MRSSREKVQDRLEKLAKGRQWEREDELLHKDECPSHPFLILEENPPETTHLLARDSKYDSDWTPQLTMMAKRCRELNVKVLSRTGGIEKGTSLEREDRKLLYEVLGRAGGSTVTVPDLTRLARNTSYQPNFPDLCDLRPTNKQIEFLQSLEREFNLKFVILNPDRTASSLDGKDYLQLLSEEASKLGGRPYKKGPGYKTKRKRDWLDFILNLRAEGLSCSEIEKELQKVCPVPPSERTIRNWFYSVGIR